MITFTQAIANRSRSLTHIYDAFNSMMDEADLAGELDPEKAIRLALAVKVAAQEAIATLKRQRRKQAKQDQREENKHIYGAT